MVDQLESTFRNAILEEERQKTQQTMFYVLVGAILPSVNSFSPCARVAIVLVDQLAQFFYVLSAQFQHQGTFVPSLASIPAPHFSPQFWTKIEQCDVDHVKSCSMSRAPSSASPAMSTSIAWSLTCPIRSSPPVMAIIDNVDLLPYRPRYRSPRCEHLLKLLLSSINFTVLSIKMHIKIIIYVFNCRGELTLFWC